MKISNFTEEQKNLTIRQIEEMTTNLQKSIGEIVVNEKCIWPIDFHYVLQDDNMNLKVNCDSIYRMDFSYVPTFNDIIIRVGDMINNFYSQTGITIHVNAFCSDTKDYDINGEFVDVYRPIVQIDVQ